MNAVDAAGRDRLAALSDAFGMDKGKVGQMAAASAAVAFSESTIALARAQPEFVREIGAFHHWSYVGLYQLRVQSLLELRCFCSLRQRARWTSS